MRCKLCNSERLIKMKTIKIEEIQVGYKIDIKKYFKNDAFTMLQCLDCQIISFDGVIPGDSEFYDYLQEMPFYYESDKYEFRKAFEYISKYNPKKILEIGAGIGYFLEKIKNVFEVRASELSLKSIRHLQSKNILLDQEGDTYDFIIAFQVLEHVENLIEFLKFVDRKLETGGLFLITVPCNDSSYFQETFDILDFPPHHMHQFNEYALKQVGKVMGYEIVEYFNEPMRIEHYFSIIRSRRKKILYRFRFLSKLYALFDYLLVPYFYKNDLKGHTHGILLRKRGIRFENA